MPEIIKVYAQEVPAVRFIGKKYGDSDRVNGGFGSKWDEWIQNGWFEPIERQAGGTERLKAWMEDGEASIGLMRWKEGEPFEYWIGMFVPRDCEVPPGYDSVDFPEGKLGVCWLHGREPEIYAKEHLCAQKLEESGYKVVPDNEQAFWFFERYGCPRFTERDQDGKVILDICHYIE